MMLVNALRNVERDIAERDLAIQKIHGYYYFSYY